MRTRVAHRWLGPLACASLMIGGGSCARSTPATTEPPAADEPLNTEATHQANQPAADSITSSSPDVRALEDALADRTNPSRSPEESETIARALVEVIDRRLLDHDGVAWAPPDRLDDYRNRIRTTLLETPRIEAWLSVDIDEDGAPEHLVQLGAPSAWEQLLVVIDHPTDPRTIGTIDRWDVVLWDIVSSRYGTPTLTVMSPSSGAPPFGFVELVGGTGTGYYSSSARFYQARNGRLRPVFDATANVSHVRGTDPSHRLKLLARFDYSASHGFQARYDLEIHWPRQEFHHEDSLTVWFPWNEAAQQYRPSPDLNDSTADALGVIEQAFEVDEATVRAAFSGR